METAEKLSFEKDLLIGKFKQEMSIEIQLLDSFFRLEEELHSAIYEKEWTRIEELVSNLKNTGTDIENIDDRRDQYFSAVKKHLGLSVASGLSEMLGYMEKEQQEEIQKLHRDLKIRVVKVKGSTGRLRYLFRTLSESLNDILGEVFPHRKGKIYSMHGRPAEYAEESVMVNRNL
ncbi:MAG: hypothetical protein GXP33_15065 [Spirochaetes bacterium]|nr:hypothetical protein [Spirochaetota bacterium]